MGRKLTVIYSMTGYAVATREILGGSGSLNLELRSVNNRYLDIQFRLPDELRSLELVMREQLTNRLQRGKVDCRLNFVRSANVENLHPLNLVLLQKLAGLNAVIRNELPDARSLDVADILRWPGMMVETDAIPSDALQEGCLVLFQTAMDELIAARSREGEKLGVILRERLEAIHQLVREVLPRIPGLIAAFRQKLETRMCDALGSCDDERIRQELTLFASKIDIDEELTRLQTHLGEVARILDKGGVVGKRLDFLMQELNREANTIGSKSTDADVSRISMELKILIEQMREQVQNIE